jgi:hypothetical protein
MNIAQAVRYPFEDQDWLVKLLMVALLSFASIIFLPLIIGLLPVAILLGYSLSIINNVRENRATVLPAWRDYGDLMTRGANVLPAIFLYNLPLLLVGCCLWVLRASIGDNVIEGLATASSLCCLVPLLLLYTALTWPMLAVGTVKYAKTGQTKVFYEVNKLYDAVTTIGSFTVQWFLATLLVNVILLTIQFIPLIGQVIALALAVPVQAHLLGQYARLVDRYDPHRKRR